MRINGCHRRFCEAVAAESAGRASTWAVGIDTVAQRLGISVFEAVVVADDCHQAGLVRDDVPKRMRGRRLPHSVTLAASGWALVKKD
jgi:hypothetical protein